MNVVVYGLLIVIVVLLTILIKQKLNKDDRPIHDHAKLVESAMQQQDFMKWVENNDRY